MSNYYPTDIPSYNDSDTFPQPRINTYDCYKCDFMLPIGVEAINPQTKRSSI